MKFIAIAVAILTLTACAGGPSKLQRIEANEKNISNLYNLVEANSLDISTNSTEIENLNIKIDRMFEKSQYK